MSRAGSYLRIIKPLIRYQLGNPPFLRTTSNKYKDMKSSNFFMLIIAMISICCSVYAFVLTDYFFSLLLVIVAVFVFDKYRKGYYNACR